MKAAVTGAGGMLGTALVPALRAAGHTVLPLSKADADVTQPDALRRPLGSFRPDWVFNLAAFTRVNECETREDYAMLVNGKGAGNVAAAAAEVGAAVMMISTDYVFDGRARTPYREDAPTDPVNAYGRSKLAGELATRAANPVRHVIVRTAWLYGKGGRNFPDTILEQAHAGKGLRVVTDQRGSPTWTQDLASGLVRLAASEAFGTFHCTNSGNCTWYEFALHLLRESRIDVSVEPISSSQSAAPAVLRPVYSVLDNRRYEEVTRHPMASWQDASSRYLTSLGSKTSKERT